MTLDELNKIAKSHELTPVQSWTFSFTGFMASPNSIMLVGRIFASREGGEPPLSEPVSLVVFDLVDLEEHQIPFFVAVKLNDALGNLLIRIREVS